MSFQPSPYSYGDTEVVEPQQTDIIERVEQFAPLIQTVGEQLTDASRQGEVLDAKIANTKQMMRRSPIGKGLLKMRLRNLRAKKRAAERRLAKQQEGESSTRTYRALGQVAIVAGIGLVLALTLRAVRR